jgi:hypothetical protein
MAVGDAIIVLLVVGESIVLFGTERKEEELRAGVGRWERSESKERGTEEEEGKAGVTSPVFGVAERPFVVGLTEKAPSSRSLSSSSATVFPRPMTVTP